MDSNQIPKIDDFPDTTFIVFNAFSYIPEKAIFHYRDVYDHLTRFFELTETLRDVATSIMEIDLSLRSNEMACAANRTNRSVCRLTFITTIFLPLSLLAGIGGMSEWSMMTGPDNWRFTYPLFLVSIAVIGILCYYLLKWVVKRDDEKSGGDNDEKYAKDAPLHFAHSAQRKVTFQRWASIYRATFRRH